MHLWLALLLIAAMGLVLGLLGGGGSILTVPILVYGLRVEAHAAISLSLILVGSTALIGAFLHQEAARVAWQRGLLSSLSGLRRICWGQSFRGTFPAQFCCCCLEC